MKFKILSALKIGGHGEKYNITNGFIMINIRDIFQSMRVWCVVIKITFHTKSDGGNKSICNKSKVWSMVEDHIYFPWNYRLSREQNVPQILQILQNSVLHRPNCSDFIYKCNCSWITFNQELGMGNNSAWLKRTRWFPLLLHELKIFPFVILYINFLTSQDIGTRVVTGLVPANV